MQEQLKQIIKEYKDSSDESPLTLEEIDRLSYILKCSMKFIEGYLSESEWLESLGKDEPITFGIHESDVLSKAQTMTYEYNTTTGGSKVLGQHEKRAILTSLLNTESPICWETVEEIVESVMGF